MTSNRSSKVFLTTNFWFFSRCREVFYEDMFSFTGNFSKLYNGEPIIFMDLYLSDYKSRIGRLSDWMIRSTFGKKKFLPENRLWVIWLNESQMLNFPRMEDFINDFNVEVLELGSKWDEEKFNSIINTIRTNLKEKNFIISSKSPVSEEKKPKLIN